MEDFLVRVSSGVAVALREGRQLTSPLPDWHQAQQKMTLISFLLVPLAPSCWAQCCKGKGTRLELRSLECDSTRVSDGMAVELEKDVQLVPLPRTSTMPNRELPCSCWAWFCREKGA